MKPTTLWIISAIVPGMIAGLGHVRTEHLVRATGKTSAVLAFIRQKPLAHDIEDPVPAKEHP